MGAKAQHTDRQIGIHLNDGVGAQKLFGDHAYHSHGVSIHIDAGPDDARVAAKTFLPIAVPENDYRSSAWSISFAGNDQPAGGGPNAQHRKEVARHVTRQQPVRVAV